MLRNTLLALALFSTSMVHAEYQCKAKPQDDVIISAQQVQVVGNNSDLQISPDGDVKLNGNQLKLSDNQRQKAFSYQLSLRSDLPWIRSGAQQRLDKVQKSLDGVIVQQLGSDSKVRQHLVTLSESLKQQMDRVIEPRSDGLTFHHQAISQVEKEGQRIAQQAMGAMLQDSLNQLGSSANGGNALQLLMGNLGGLQQSLQQVMQSQEKDLQLFANEVCQRVTTLEQQRQNLLIALK